MFKEITPLPPPPSISDSAGFNEKADIFVNALPKFGGELNCFIHEVNGLLGGLSSYEEGFKEKIRSYSEEVLFSIKEKIKNLTREAEIRIEAAQAIKYSDISLILNEVLFSLERLQRMLLQRQKIGEYTYFLGEKLPKGYVKSGESVLILKYPLAWRIISKNNPKSQELAPDGYFIVPTKNPNTGSVEAVYLGE